MTTGNNDMPSCSKICYATQDVAEFHLGAIRRINGRRGKRCPTGSYLCPYCRAWHLTSHSRSQVAPWVKAAGRPNGRG
jgi:hypothetical protein